MAPFWPNSSPRLLSVQYLEDKSTCMNWKLCYSRVHGQIHLAAQFTSGVLSHFQNAPWKVGFLVLKGQKMRPLGNSKTKSQRSESRWVFSSHITCAKFQLNRLTSKLSAPEHFLRQRHLKPYSHGTSTSNCCWKLIKPYWTWIQRYLSGK